MVFFFPPSQSHGSLSPSSRVDHESSLQDFSLLSVMSCELHYYPFSATEVSLPLDRIVVIVTPNTFPDFPFLISPLFLIRVISNCDFPHLPCVFTLFQDFSPDYVDFFFPG